MRQVTQRLKDGRIELREVPTPAVDEHSVLIDVRASLLSAGTERTKVVTAREGLIGKARARPDDARQVLEKARRDGIRQTVEAVRTRLGQPSPLGYSAAGVVLAVGDRVRGISPGDHVACGGAGAAHAEIIRVPGNLCVRIPGGMEWAHAAFTTVGSIALQGVRQGEPRLGERVAVIGLGLVGRLCCQLLRAAGCTVVGLDISADLVGEALLDGSISHGFVPAALDDASVPAEASACDVVIIAASTTSSDPIELAARLCRDRGRIVVVGAVGMTVPRGSFYDKELELRLSRSYGPGRYDSEYEERGLDYPIGYVRWTEQRNMQAFVDLLAEGRIGVASLISERIPFAHATRAYDELVSSARSPLGIVLEYDESASPKEAPPVKPILSSNANPAVNLGVIGAGSFAQRILIPTFRDAGFELVAVASQSGLSASSAAARFGFRRAVSATELLADQDVATVAIATRHATHAQVAGLALEAGHPVFVEKPPCLTESELQGLRAAREASQRPLVVGFNRRHAPLAQRLREHIFGRSAPIELLVRVNAGRLDAGHWLNDLDDGGGRLLGEGCHFIDFACWVIGLLPTNVSCRIPQEPDLPIALGQRFACALTFVDGSIATILYGAESSSRVGKEYIEAHSGGRSAILDDFRSLTLSGKGRRPMRRRNRGQDKGHAAQAIRLRDLVTRGMSPPDDLDPLDSMSVTLAALRSAQESGAAHQHEANGDSAQ
jgi:predicted dehydrogenase/threonine dehydrogenase-like Zn-dependent dehydrogenase